MHKTIASLGILLCLHGTASAMENQQQPVIPPLGSPVVLQPGQKFICYLDLPERPVPGDMVIFKRWPNKYFWGKVYEVTNDILFADERGKRMMEMYAIINKESDDKKSASHHFTDNLYKIIDENK